MLFLTRWFGVTGSQAERNLAAEPAVIGEIVERILVMQTNVAAQRHCPLARGTHAKGVCARAEFEVLDVTAGRDRALAARLAKGIYAKPGVYPAIVRFANSDPHVNSDSKADVRALSFSIARAGWREPRAPGLLDAERADAPIERRSRIPGGNECIDRVEPCERRMVAGV